MKVVEISTILVYMVAVLAIGIGYSRIASRSTTDYWVANRSIGPFVNGVALEAANSSAAALLGFVGLGYSMGLSMALLTGMGSGMGLFMAQILTAAPLRRSGYYTIPEFFAARFSGKLTRLVPAILVIIWYWAYIIPQMNGAGLVAEHLLNINYVAAVLVAGLVMVFYVSVGGMWSVTWTELIQGLLLSLTIVTVGTLAAVKIGGIGILMQKAVEARPDIYLANPKLSPLTYIGFYIALVCFCTSTPHIIMRCFTAKDSNTARASMIVTLFLHPMTYTIGYLLTVSAAWVFFPNLEKADMATILLVDKLMPPVFAGILFGGILSAVMSTAGSMLISIGAAIAHDVYGVIKPDAPEKVRLNTGKAVIWIVGILATLAAIKPPHVIGVLVGLVLGGIAASFFLPLILGMYWKRCNYYGVNAGMIGGAVTYIIMYFSKALPKFAEILVALPVALVLIVGVSLLTKPLPTENPELVDKIHDITSNVSAGELAG